MVNEGDNGTDLGAKLNFTSGENRPRYIQVDFDMFTNG